MAWQVQVVEVWPHTLLQPISLTQLYVLAAYDVPNLALLEPKVRHQIEAKIKLHDGVHLGVYASYST